MKHGKKGLSLLLIFIMTMVLISGCTAKSDNAKENGSGESVQNTEASDGADSTMKAAALDTSEQVELVLYILGTEPNRQQEVNDNLNKLLLKKFNCTLKINWIGWADYSNMYPLLFSSGEEFDMAYAATWLNFASLAQKGAFMSLDELWPSYAPDNFAKQSETAKKQATIAGHYYCVPTLLATYSAYGLTYRTDIMKGTAWNGKMDNFEDMEAYMDIVKATHPEMEPLDIYSGGSEVDDLFMYQNSMFRLNDYLFFDPSEENPKLFTFYEYDKTKDFLSMMARWNEKGFFSKSALSDSDSEKTKNGKAAILIHNIDSYQSYYIEHPEWGFKFSNFVKDLSYLAFTQDSMVISNTSKHPELAMAVYNYLTTDEEAYRAFQWGIEGTSYEITDKNELHLLNQDDYAVTDMWAARNSEFNLNTMGSPEDLTALKAGFDAQIKEGVGAQKYRSFVFDTSSIETEYAACMSVHQQYWWPLELGYTDAVSGLEEYKEKMKVAGIDKVRETLQKQLDEYVAGLK